MVTLVFTIAKFDGIAIHIPNPKRLWIATAICFTSLAGITLYCTLSSNWVQKQSPLLKALAYRDRPNPTALDQKIEFGTKGNGHSYLTGNISNLKHENGGWAIPEAWGVWSNGNSATLDLPVPIFPVNRHIITLHATMRAFVTHKNPQQNIAIYINNRFIKSVTLSKADQNDVAIDMPVPDPKDPKTQLHYKIEFKIDNAQSPASLGIGKDDRLIAIGLEQIVFKQKD